MDDLPDPSKLTRSKQRWADEAKFLTGRVARPEEMRLPRTTVQSWCDRNKWRDADPIRVMEDSVEVRFCALVAKEAKTGGDFKETNNAK